MQLVAYGAQDIYLTGNPQITFFKVVYRRHTNFSMECIQQTINGTSVISATSDTQGEVTISRNGDLITRVYACFTVGGVSSTGLNQCDQLVKQAELQIGGQMIDRQPLKWMQIWNELSIPNNRVASFQEMTGLTGRSLTTTGDLSTGNRNLVQVPLQFWFCRNPGLALPLIALQYHEVILKLTWGSSNDAVYHGGAGATTDTPNCEVWVDYIYLDTDERRRFAQVSHEYLIEQVQVLSGKEAATHDLTLNHPVKELIWLNNGHLGSNKAKLVLNGHDRFAPQFPEYFQYRQPHDYHSRTPHVVDVPGKKHIDLGGSSIINSFTGVVYDTSTGLASTEAAVDGSVVGFCCCNTAGSAAASGTNVKAIILDSDLAISADDDLLLILSKGDHHTLAIVTVLAFSGGLLTFTPQTVNSLSMAAIGEVTATTHHLAITKVADKQSSLEVHHVFTGDTGIGTTVAKFTMVDKAGSSVTPDDGRSIVLPANLDIHVGEYHRVVHTDTSLITGPAAHPDGHKETIVHVDSYNHTTGLIRYDKQVAVTKTAATAAPDFLQIEVLGVSAAISGPSSLHQHINVYSFALKPEEHQPSGTCNFSRIDNAKLIFDSSVDIEGIYAVNYNVLRIMSGMGGLAYSN